MKCKLRACIMFSLKPDHRQQFLKPTRGNPYKSKQGTQDHEIGNPKP